jgi:hypothetical protein
MVHAPLRLIEEVALVRAGELGEREHAMKTAQDAAPVADRTSVQVRPPLLGLEQHPSQVQVPGCMID